MKRNCQTKPSFNTTHELNSYLLELINTDRDKFIKFDMQNIIKNARAKLKADM